MDLVKYLIEGAQCSVNVQNEDYRCKDQDSTIGSTALHAACYEGHLDIEPRSIILESFLTTDNYKKFFSFSV
jgi:hypothetical protein